MSFHNEISKAFATIREMLLDRKSEDADVEEYAADLNALSPEDAVALAKTRQVFQIDLPSCKCRIIFDLNDRFKVSTIRKYLESAPEAFSKVIVVTKETSSTTSSAIKNVIDSYPSLNIEFFRLLELQFNVSRHTYVPRHEPIRNEDEIVKLCEQYYLKNRFQFPIIQSSDPMARYFNLSHGQLVKITRQSLSASETVLYRCCMKVT